MVTSTLAIQPRENPPPRRAANGLPRAPQSFRDASRFREYIRSLFSKRQHSASSRRSLSRSGRGAMQDFRRKGFFVRRYRQRALPSMYTFFSRNRPRIRRPVGSRSLIVQRLVQKYSRRRRYTCSLDRAVRAGAKHTISISPAITDPGTGLAHYVQSRYASRFFPGHISL